MSPRSPASSTSSSASSDPAAGRDALEAAVELHRREPLAEVLRPRGLGPYRGYGELLAAMLGFVQRGAKVRVIGRSILHEPLFALELGDTDSRRARTSVVLSGVHPSEWIGVETSLRLFERMIGRELGERTLLAVPIVNPDGLMRVEDNLRHGRRRFVRHNARGVDLNRNFDARWGKRGLPQRLVPWVFAPGSRAASEPEVEAIAYELGSRRIDRAVSLHSFGGVVMYPLASSIWPIADAAEHRTWATRVARAADSKPYRALPCSWWSLGLTQGGLELDWFHERHGALSLLVECSRGGVGMRPALGRPSLRAAGLGRVLEPFAWFNPPGVDAVTLRLAEALEPFVRGEKA